MLDAIGASPCDPGRPLAASRRARASYQGDAFMNRKVLITGATGDTGRAAVKEAIALGLTVRAMVHGRDDRSAALEKLGAGVVVGDLHNIDSIRAAMEAIDAAYLVYP